MQVPEKLALIGGSILLGSTLVFTLKSQASSIIPHVSHSISSIFSHIDDSQQDSGFFDAYQQAQEHDQPTGKWGTALYYIDKGHTMHVGTGQIQGSLYDIIGTSQADQLRTLSFDRSVRAPQDSTRLLSAAHYGVANDSLKQINHIDRLDTSQVSSMYSMFADDNGLTNLDLSSWHTDNLNSTYTMFNADTNLQQVNLSHWNTQKLRTAGWMFYRTTSLQSLDLSSWDAHDIDLSSLFVSNNNLKSLDLSGVRSNANSQAMLVDTTAIDHLTLGNDTRLSHISGVPNATWQNGNQFLHTDQLEDSNPHSGTWIKR